MLKISVLVIFSISKTLPAVKFAFQNNRDLTSGCIWHFSESTISYFIFKYKFGAK